MVKKAKRKRYIIDGYFYMKGTIHHLQDEGGGPLCGKDFNLGGQEEFDRINRGGVRCEECHKKRKLQSLKGRCVYFLEDPTTKKIKIGSSTPRNLTERIKGIQTGCPSKLRLLLSVTDVLEKDVHKMFHEDRTIGEWFSPSPELISYIIEKSRAGIGVN